MNTEHPVSAELLQQFLDASGIGWWRLDFGQREMTCSRLAAELIGADDTRIPFDDIYLLPGEEHRARIYTRCAALKVTDRLDETLSGPIRRRTPGRLSGPSAASRTTIPKTRNSPPSTGAIRRRSAITATSHN